jgi:hypothetical protein
MKNNHYSFCPHFIVAAAAADGWLAAILHIILK